MEEYKHIHHEFGPVYDAASQILILGSFPSVKSREVQFYYGHPQNRFWRLLAKLTREEVPATVLEKRSFLLRNHIAVWDVIASCSIQGSSDSTIRDVIVNDFSGILAESSIKKIYVNGGKAYDLYTRYAQPLTGIKAIKLPSTSPANAAWNLERLEDAWKQILE
ncbi:MAG: DNA-deoxyinosine glycosylase [Lachnospiraceae bacterium]|nr:DNA-deoxyinosine glycosylase [Lachnospiraceae bacterium]